MIVATPTGSTAYALSLRQAVYAAGLPLVTITGPSAGWANAIMTPIEEASETYTVSYTAALGVLGLLAHQLVDTPAQAAFMEGAWAMVLGRLKAGVTRASNPGAVMLPRPSRPKLRPAEDQLS